MTTSTTMTGTATTATGTAPQEVAVYRDKDALLHRDNDEPAVVWEDGSLFWYQSGKLHRENDKPAVVLASGRKEWWTHGELHRGDDLPAVIGADGLLVWCQSGKVHRDGGRAAVVQRRTFARLPVPVPAPAPAPKPPLLEFYVTFDVQVTVDTNMSEELQQQQEAKTSTPSYESLSTLSGVWAYFRRELDRTIREAFAEAAARKEEEAKQQKQVKKLE